MGRPRRTSRTFSAEWLCRGEPAGIGPIGRPGGRPGACRAGLIAIEPLYGRGSRFRSWTHALVRPRFAAAGLRRLAPLDHWWTRSDRRSRILARGCLTFEKARETGYDS